MLSALILLMPGPALPPLEPVYRHAVELRAKSHGAGSPEVADALANLAAFLARERNTEEPRRLLQRALTIVSGRDAARESRFLIRIAGLSAPAEAERQLRRALSLSESAEASVMLADLLSARDRHAEAADLYGKAFELHTAPAARGAAANSLALALEAAEKRDEAERWFLRSAAEWEQAVGRDHPEYASVLVNMAGYAKARGETPAAIGMLRHAVAVFGRTTGLDHPHAQAACAALTELTGVQGCR